ncbi:(2Fe-2S)-binding protein [Mycobacterium sp. 1554424.7]|nr:(2Fe-2S)-binding protein [Mycobacterium sp. 1554424.7]
MSDIILGPIDDVPVGEGRTYAIGDRQIAVFRLRDGSLRALDAVCPHRGGPLADGLTDGRVVVCPLHGFTYDLETGCEIANGGAEVTSYPVQDSGVGTIQLRVGGKSRRPQNNGADSHPG